MFRILWRECAPGLLGSVLLLPLVLMDCLRISHRFAGPMVRLRAAMKQLATGKTIAPVRLRDDDFWKDFADDLNQLADRVATHRESICSSADGCVSGRSSEAGASDAALEQQLKSAI